MILMINKDCFAYGTSLRCRILTEVVCKNNDCKFYKTKQQYKADLEKYPPIDYKNLYENKHKNEVKSNEKQ